VFEDREPRRIFGPEREAGTGNRRKLHNKELRKRERKIESNETVYFHQPFGSRITATSKP
jgi:hypothetical protein